jgi:predicted dehydrogenase
MGGGLFGKPEPAVPEAAPVRKLRYGLIGAGSAARTHLRDILGVRGVELVGIADPAPPEAWRIPKEHAGAPRFADARAMLRGTAPDLVSVCTPTAFHCDLVLQALAAGAHVVCEKPMAMTLAQAEAMEQARQAADRLGAIHFSCRNVPSFRAVRDLVLSGRQGRVTRVNAVYLQAYLGDPKVPWSWRSDVDLAGFGALGDLGVHMIDSVRFLTGLEFQRVVGTAQTLIPEKTDAAGARRRVTTDSNAAFLAELSGGVVATFETSQVAAGYADFLRLDICTEGGALTINREQPDRVWHRPAGRPGGKTEFRERQLGAEAPRGPPSAAGAIVHAIRGEAVPYPSFADGIATQRVLAALQASIATGAWAAVG